MEMEENNITIDLTESGLEDVAKTPRIQKKKRGRPAKKNLNPKPKANRMAEVEDMQVARQSQTLTQLLRLIDKTAEALANVEVEDLIDSYEDADIVEALRTKCEALVNILHTPEAPKKTHAGDAPSTIEHYDNFYVHRAAGNLVYLLRPVEVFKGLSNIYTRRKVFGFIQPAGDKFPLMFALPGWIQATEHHPRMLDSSIWTKAVLNWGKFHNHSFRIYPFDEHHRVEEGSSYASHVEPKLMLWFACHQLMKNGMGVKGDIISQLGELWRLPRVKKPMEAEIILSEAPCGPCQEFQEKIEDYTCIKFNIIVSSNLGILKATRNKYGYKIYPLDASEDDNDDDINDDDADDDDDGDDNYGFRSLGRRVNIRTESHTSLQVIIPSSPKSPKVSRPIESDQDDSSLSQELPGPSTSRSSKKKIQAFSFNTPKNKSQKSPLDSDSDDLTWTPSKPQKYVQPRQRHSSSTRRCPTLSDRHFGREAYDHSKAMKKNKRKQGSNFEESPSAGKSRRHSTHL